ncbi:class I SAM-dependent methyltransferase [Quatrionicoccus australiensis]|uniref:class I SAM-dependent methyltransferase n=1 Tax=Quatrionicoccus australiensis TaxID=138118 RepID=UPI001CFA157C|nr:class I SAM-dependent methyltransferase [Quatrionicoccus australiensis]MCB4360181.1 class I SAM-dependent methyltransferase [Quatrionicoccus australiensis]
MNQSMELLVDRESRIRELCRGKKVLDIGCCAHGEFAGRGSNNFLHGEIAKIASELVGLDNDRDSVAEMVKQGFNVICGDAENLEATGLSGFDVIVAGEIIEHLSNPGMFIDGAYKLLSPGGYFLVTVPNAWSFTRLKQLRKGIDDSLWTHDQHTCWYSKATVQALLKRFDFVIETLGFCTMHRSNQPLKRFRDRIRLGWAMKPAFAESIFVAARKP